MKSWLNVMTFPAVVLCMTAVLTTSSGAPLSDVGAMYPVSPDAEPFCTKYWGVKSLFYNRIPKAGSTTLRAVLWRLSRGLEFSFHSSNDYTDRGWFDQKKEKSNAQRIHLVLDMDKRTSHSVYDQHTRYINFTRHEIEQPAYINMMRDPVGRMVSSYYYALRGSNNKKEQIRDKLSNQADWSIEECIQRKDECKWLLKKSAKDFNLMTAFFCGHAPECKEINHQSMITAKKNIRDHYVLVGLTERFKESILLFEALLPQYFTAGVEAYNMIEKMNVNAAPSPTPSATSRDYLASLAQYDYELYDYAETLMNQKMMCVSPVREDPPKRSQTGL